VSCGSKSGAGASPDGGSHPDAATTNDASVLHPDGGAPPGDSASGAESGTAGDSGASTDSTTPATDGPAEATTDASTRPARPPNAYNLGMNVPGLTYYNNAAIYADLALQIAGNNGPWDNANGMGAAPLDATGAPTVAASSGVTSNYPSGAYTVTWDGTGSFTFASGTLGPVTKTMSGGVQHNTATLTLTQQLSTATSDAWFQIKATPPVTNFHVMAPASLTRPNSMFVADFEKAMHPFSTLRFMDALNTNGNLIQTWSQRTWPSAGSRANTPQGMAYEDIIALANETGADVWINVPALANDDYVCRLARLFRYGEQGLAEMGDASTTPCSAAAPAGNATTAPLNPGSKVYVEFSNEIWNWGFQQTEDFYCMVWGMPDKTGNGKHCDVTAPTSALGKTALANAALPWSTNTYEKATQFTFLLAKQVSDVFRQVFGCAGGAGCQAQIPINVQAAYAAEADPGLSFLKMAYGSTGAFDAMAVAPYFNLDDASEATSVNAIFTVLDANIGSMPDAAAGSAIANWLMGDLAEANMYGLPIIAYEGGQGLNGIDVTMLQSAESDPRMYTAYQTYYALWDTLIGRSHLFNHYSYVSGEGSYGAWGALVNQDDPGSQKWDALLSLTSWPGDANLDGVVNALDCAIVTANYQMTGQWWEEGDFNHDGVVNALDVTIMNANIQGPACMP
jgi:hypothetical protein